MKKWKFVFTACFCLLLFLAAFCVLRFRNSKAVTPESAFDTGMAAVLYRQDDDRWADQWLGESEYSMKSSGCLVSCIASALSMEGGEELTPGGLNWQFSENDAYDAEGNLLWEELRKIDGYGVDVCQEVSSELIEDYLRQGKYPIARVRMDGIGNYHYVLIVGAGDGTFFCMDPLRDEVTPLSHYLNRVYALRCVYREETEDFDVQENRTEIDSAGD